MRRADIRGVIAELEGCLKLTEGLNVFRERMGVWSEDYGLLLRIGAVSEDSFECVTQMLVRLGLAWELVTLGEEAYIRIYSPRTTT